MKDGIDLHEAAELLDLHYQSVRSLIKKGQLTPFYPHGRGVAKPVVLDPREVIRLRNSRREGKVPMRRKKRDRKSPQSKAEATS